jgi:ribonuclease P protein component
VAGDRPVGRFPASQRVRRRGDFARAKAAGRRVATPHFALVLSVRPPSCLPASPLPPRLGIVASRKVGNAVRRNRAKRLIREAFRATRDLWNPGLDLIVIVTRPLTGMGLADVIAEWREQAARITRRSHALLHPAERNSGAAT